jgi:glycosyltransferase involved in cell wall biosynthesis
MHENLSQNPFVSFCVSTYKRGEILKNTLKSIKLQTFTDFEVIISDNDPDGSGREFVESLNDKRFKYFNNGKNLGMKPSFNKSLDRSTGDFIVMIADDDPVYPDMLETLVGLRNDYPGYGMYMGGCDWFCIDKEVAKMYKLKVGTNSYISSEYDLNFVKAFPTSDFIASLFTFKIFPHYLWSTCIVKKDILIGMGGVPDYGTAFLGDYAYMSIAATGKGCVIINKSLGCQTIHKENFGRNQNDQLPLLLTNFPNYLEMKLSYLKEWPEIKKDVMRFLGIWVTGHLAFLYHYNKKNNLPDNGFAIAERDVLKNDIAKKFRFKYLLKKRFPFFHDAIVIAKMKVAGKV